MRFLKTLAVIGMMIHYSVCALKVCLSIAAYVVKFFLFSGHSKHL